MLEYEPGGNINKAYEREVRLLSHDNQYFLMAIGIRNAAAERAHTDCGVAVLDIDIPYAKDENNLARTAAYEWSNYIVQKLKE